MRRRPKRLGCCPAQGLEGKKGPLSEEVLVATLCTLAHNRHFGTLLRTATLLLTRPLYIRSKDSPCAVLACCSHLTFSRSFSIRASIRLAAPVVLASASPSIHTTTPCDSPSSFSISSTISSQAIPRASLSSKVQAALPITVDQLKKLYGCGVFTCRVGLLSKHSDDITIHKHRSEPDCTDSTPSMHQRIGMRLE